MFKEIFKSPRNAIGIGIILVSGLASLIAEKFIIDADEINETIGKACKKKDEKVSQ